MLNKKKQDLTQRLEELLDEEVDDENLEEIIEVKLARNMEAGKEEIFWEQRARAN